jgi:hypothetical protein
MVHTTTNNPSPHQIVSNAQPHDHEEKDIWQISKMGGGSQGGKQAGSGVQLLSFWRMPATTTPFARLWCQTVGSAWLAFFGAQNLANKITPALFG